MDTLSLPALAAAFNQFGPLGVVAAVAVYFAGRYLRSKVAAPVAPDPLLPPANPASVPFPRLQKLLDVIHGLSGHKPGSVTPATMPRDQLDGLYAEVKAALRQRVEQDDAIRAEFAPPAGAVAPAAAPK